MPRAGRDYPGSYAEVLSWFPDDAACLDYLEWLRGPDGIPLPAVRGPRGVAAGERSVGVRGLRHQASVTAGTIFHRTRTPLGLWFAAAWQMTSQKHGAVGTEGAAVAGGGLLSDGLGDAAPLPGGDGAPWARTAVWACGGR